MNLFYAVYLISTILFLLLMVVVGKNEKAKKYSIKHYFIYALGIILGLKLAVSDIKSYIIIGAFFAFLEATVYSLIVTDQDSVEQLENYGISFTNILFLCAVSIFAWPQLVLINVIDYFSKKN